MEKLLHLYKYVDGKNDAPFPSKEQQAILFEFKYDAKRMGDAPTITGTLMHPLCLDELWGDGMVYVTYNSERYFLKQTPTSSYSNEDTRYKHEVDFVSERIALSNVYFYDVVTGDTTNDKPVSNSSNVTFYGDIHEFAQRLNYSLQYAQLEYSVVVDSGIASESKLVSFQKQFFANVLQEGYKLFETPYYFEGKVIHFGYTNNTINKLFSYGAKDALLSISKNNITQRIVNRITGVGSADNIPYYYPNFDPKGVSEVLFNGEVNNLVSIENLIKYKKVKLGDTFIYNYESDKVVEYVDKSKYVVSKDITLLSENYETTKRYELVLDFPFSVDIAPQSSIIELNYSKTFLTNFKARLYRNLELRDTFTSFGETSYYRLIEGEYNFSISLEFTFGEFDEKTELTESDIPAIVDALTISITSDVYGFEQWTLNTANNIVKLNDYGLKLNTSPKNGDKITFRQVSYIPPQPNLMPPIYRETLGAERFYNALNDTYYNSDNNAFYSFENPFIKGKNKEDDVSFEDIKPSIKGVTNANGLRIDMFSEFAYDLEDNDEFDEEGNYLHPYFFGKLRKFDGDFGFNLFDHAIEEDEMVISMTSGSCGGCNFIIGVDSQQQKNIVQVDENGNLKRDANGNVLYGSPQERQNDTRNYEVWVALKKDIETFGVIMPNATNNYRPNAGDTFVILHIDLPNAYILAAEERLREELIKYMKENNSEKFNFSLSFSRIFFAENPTILAQLNENARIKIAYNNNAYTLYVSSYSYSMNTDTALPEIRVELSEELAIVKESIIKQLANASLYLNKEVQRVNTSVATTNTTISKNTATAQASITKTNARVENVEKVVMNLQSNSGGSGGGGQGGINEEQLEKYLTTNQYAKKSDIPSLDAYAKSDDVANTYATKSALKGVSDSVGILREDFDNLNDILNGNVGGVIDSWNEVVSFLDGYKDSDDLAAILSGMNTNIANRVLIEDFEKLEDSVTDIASYFTNGSANNALKLGGQLPSYYATADALNIVKNDVIAVSNRVKTFEDVIGIDANGDVYIKGTRNFYTAGGTIGMAGLGSGGSGGGGAAPATIRIMLGETPYDAVNGIVSLPAYPSLSGYATQSWVESKKYLTAHQDISHLLSKTDAASTYQPKGNYLTSVSWDIVSGKPTFAAVATSGKYSDLSGLPTIPTNNNQLTNGAGYITSTALNGYATQNWVNSNYLLNSGGTISKSSYVSLVIQNTASDLSTILFKGVSGDLGYLGFNGASNPVYMAPSGYAYTLIYTGNYADTTDKRYLQLSGGTIEGHYGALSIKRNSAYPSLIKFENTSGAMGYLGFNSANIPVMYTADAITPYTLLHENNYSSYALPLTGGRINGILRLQRDEEQNYIVFDGPNNTARGYLGFAGDNNPIYIPKEANTIYPLLHSGNYSSYALPLSGGTIESSAFEPLRFKRTATNGGIVISFENAGGYIGQLGVYVDGSNNGYPVFGDKAGNAYSLIHSGNIGSQSVNSATKLATARTIWGQSFDGTGNVSGSLTSAYTVSYDTTNGYLVGHRDFYFGDGVKGLVLASMGSNPITFANKGVERMRVTPDGNVLMGATTDSGEKLQVYGGSIKTDANLVLYTGAITWLNSAANYSIQIKDDGQAYYKAYYGHRFYTDGVERFRVGAGGNIIVGKGAYISATDASDTARGILELTASQNRLILGYGIASAGYDTSLQGNNIEFAYGTSHLVGMKLTSAGNVSMYGNLTVSGGATFGGDIWTEGTIAMAKLASSSDAKLKENIKWLSADRAMGVVRALRPTEWDWKKDNTHSFGFIAQDVQPIIPEMVSSVNDTLRLEYNQLHAFEIGAIKYIDSEVEQLKKDLKIANNRIEELESKLKQYELWQ